MTEKLFYTYIILTEKDTLYCGYTDDVEKRYKKHIEGTASKFTRAFKPKKLVYQCEHASKELAMKEEYRVKQLTKKQKLDLIQQYQNNKKEAAD